MKTKICFILLLAIVSVSIGISGATINSNQNPTVYVEELLFSGDPKIISMTLTPDRIKPGMGDITATVDVYNYGSVDTISVGIPSGIGFTAQTVSSNDIKIEKGGHYIFVFRIIPTTKVITDTEYTVRAIATAQGSGKAVEMSRKYTLQPEPTECSPGFDVILFVFSIAALLIIRVSKK